MKTIGLFGILLSVLFLIGCGQKNPYDTTPVTGTVLVDGKAMEGVSVMFAPTTGEGQAAGGMTDAQGRFTLTVGGAPVGSGALEGEYYVTFIKQEMEGQGLNFEEYKAKFGDRAPQTVHIIPEKYSDAKESGVDPVRVEKGKKNDFPFSISTK